jgi:hypothetical protein
METIRSAIEDFLTEMHPATDRQTFYNIASKRRLIDKEEREYHGTIVRLLGQMRRSGRIPFEWIADNTRWMRKPSTYSSLADMLERSAQFYRRALWDSAPVYVEIWLEKDSLAGVIYDVTEEYDVPLMVTKGYPSLSFLHGAAGIIKRRCKPTYLYYFGDSDPSGRDISRAVEDGIREFAPECEIHFERVAVTDEQIAEWNLPTRPTKSDDPRAKKYHGPSVELDSIEPDVLRDLVRAYIVQHIDVDELKRLEAIEEAGRATLKNLATVVGRGEDGTVWTFNQSKSKQ